LSPTPSLVESPATNAGAAALIAGEPTMAAAEEPSMIAGESATVAAGGAGNGEPGKEATGGTTAEKTTIGGSSTLAGRIAVETGTTAACKVAMSTCAASLGVEVSPSAIPEWMRKPCMMGP